MASALDEAEALFGAPTKKKPSALEEAEALPVAPAREKMGKPMAGLLGGAQGGSFGTADEGVGVLSGVARFFGIGNKDHEIPRATTREGKPIDPATLSAVNRRNAANPALKVPEREETVTEAYRGGRDSAREDLEQARDDQPEAAYGMEIAASIANPIKAPIKTPPGAGFFAKVGRGAARAGVEGGAYAAGASTADLTKGDVGGFARDVGVGGGLSAGLGGVGSAIGAGIQGGAQGLRESAKKRILNEIGESPSGKRATPTAYKRLDKVGDNIVAEVIDGPDGDLVRKAATGPAAEGRQIIDGLMEPLRQGNAEAYGAFAQAGRGSVDPKAYSAALKAAADDAFARGKVADAKGLKLLQRDFAEMVNGSGGRVDLPGLRGFTTETQGAAAGALGGLNDHTTAKLKGRLSAVATGIMDDMLDQASAGSPELQAAAQAIRANNRRISGLAQVDETLRAKATAENTEKGFLRRTAEGSAPLAALGAVGGLAADDENQMENALKGAVVGAVARRGIPALGRAAERGVTSATIRAARGGASDGPARVSKNVAPWFARLGAGARGDEEKKR
jgi:hypothetical protein